MRSRNLTLPILGALILGALIPVGITVFLALTASSAVAYDNATAFLTPTVADVLHISLDKDAAGNWAYKASYLARATTPAKADGWEDKLVEARAPTAAPGADAACIAQIVKSAVNVTADGVTAADPGRKKLPKMQ